MVVNWIHREGKLQFQCGHHHLEPRIVLPNNTSFQLLKIFLLISAGLDTCIWSKKRVKICILFKLHKKLSFPLRISSISMNKSRGNCRFGHIYWKTLNGKLYFLYSVSVKKYDNSPADCLNQIIERIFLFLICSNMD